MSKQTQYTALEICAGAGGQALGVSKAGFRHVAAIEIDEHACATLKANLDHLDGCRVLNEDLHEVDGTQFKGIDLFAGGVPCPPFSIAGKQLGSNDERDLFPVALRLIKQSEPRAVMLENVRGLASDKFRPYLNSIIERLRRLGYKTDWSVLNASDFGVPQLRPRFILVAMRPEAMAFFKWPKKSPNAVTVAEAIAPLLAANGWKGVEGWKSLAAEVAPTVVGGSKKHGGPDLGPTRAKRQWAALGVDGMGIAAEAPGHDFPPDGKPKLTVRMVARLQGFPDKWDFVGGKTAAYRQVGNAFPPPVAQAVARSIKAALAAHDRKHGTPQATLRPTGTD